MAVLLVVAFVAVDGKEVVEVFASCTEVDGALEGVDVIPSVLTGALEISE